MTAEHGVARDKGVPGYVRNYMLADGTAVSETDLVIDYDANGNIVYGFYQPTFTFAEMNIFRN